MANFEESSDDEDRRLFLLDTALENGLSFADCWRHYDNTEDFLRREKYISVRGTVVISDADLDELAFSSDIDGVTIVWKNIGLGLLSDFRHLEVLLLWGHPMTAISRIYATNLGPGLEYPTRSRTDQMGFLCLEDSNTCCVDDSTLPPICLYSKNLTVQRRIENVSGLYNRVGGSEMVLGRNVLMPLLKDFHTSGHVFLTLEQFTMLLKTSHGNANKRIVGGVCI